MRTLEMDEALVKLIKSIMTSDGKEVQRSAVDILRKSSGAEEDDLIIVLSEAIRREKIKPCDDIATKIAGVVFFYKKRLHRPTMLIGIANGLITADNQPKWLEDVLFKETILAPEERWSFWDRISNVQFVKGLFNEAQYSTAIEQRCKPKRCSSNA